MRIRNVALGVAATLGIAQFASAAQIVPAVGVFDPVFNGPVNGQTNPSVSTVVSNEAGMRRHNRATQQAVRELKAGREIHFRPERRGLGGVGLLRRSAGAERDCDQTAGYYADAKHRPLRQLTCPHNTAFSCGAGASDSEHEAPPPC